MPWQHLGPPPTRQGEQRAKADEDQSSPSLPRPLLLILDLDPATVELLGLRSELAVLGRLGRTAEVALAARLALADLGSGL